MTSLLRFVRRRPLAFSSVLLVFTLIFCAVADFFVGCASVRENVLRLHVIASSDSAADQEVKLKVRDAVLENGAELFDGSVTAGQAEEKITPRLAEVEQTADRVLKENGFDYTASAMVVNEYFDVRQYGDLTLPAGKYHAVKIVLGEGRGQNWWCVMFPPLCLPAAEEKDEEAFAVFGGSNEKIVSGKKEYQIRFRIVEAAEKLLKRLRKD